MPVISVKMAGKLPSKAELDAVASEITEVFVKRLGKAKERVVINFSEVDEDAFYFGAKSVGDIKKGV